MVSTKKILLTVDEELHKAIKLEAAKQGVNMHDYCVKSISDNVASKKVG